MSSVQDWMLGQKERAARNLNWSATLSYYSLVHGGRLICFLALGDYPTSHASLRRVFSPRQQPRIGRPPARNRYPFDWLRGFAALADDPRGPELAPEATADAASRQMIADYFNQLQVAAVEQRLDKLGAILAAAGPLRNDSNYEALLIAHEYRHVAVSAAFDRLSLHMNMAAESTVPFLVDAFNGFRRHDPDLQGDRAAYEAFLHEYANDRIADAIRRKVGHSPTMNAKIGQILTGLATRRTAIRYDHLEAQISMAVFEPKAHLMRDFAARIEALEEETRA